MSEEYILTKHDLHLLLGFRLQRVDNWQQWLYTPNANFNGKSPKEAADLEEFSFEDYEAAFVAEFGNVELVIPAEMFSLPKLTAIFKRYPNAIQKEM